ncbi:MAG: hypothetical protein CMJ83_11275 [Planctomycetes bacterium]|nr:hypothetical protein [Planctomycetota bacterium]
MIRILALLAVCIPLIAQPGQKAPADAPKTYKVQTHRNLKYVEGEDAHRRQVLDLNIPMGAKKPPLVLFIHGGAWMMGSKTWYRNVARTIAKEGFAVALNNYRLSPGVKHPVHVDDCARALAFLVKQAPKYGYDPTRVFLGGHSAGGHLSSLLALSPKMMKKQGLERSIVKGVFPVSGVYDCRSNHRMFRSVFGTDAKIRAEASPVVQINEESPPFLVLFAQSDLQGLAPDARSFVKALEKAKRPVQHHQIADRNHNSISSSIGRKGDPTTRYILQFLKEHRGVRRQ